jgi:hypothetical protein
MDGMFVEDERGVRFPTVQEIALEGLRQIADAYAPIRPIIRIAMRVASLKGHLAEYLFLWYQVDPIAKGEEHVSLDLLFMWEYLRDVVCGSPEELQSIQSAVMAEFYASRTSTKFPDHWCAFMADEMHPFILHCKALDETVGFGGDDELEMAYDVVLEAYIRLRLRVEAYLRAQAE